MPTQVTAYVDRQNNMTQFRADVTVDAVGNLIFFENSNEETVLISPPDGANSYMLNALPVVKVFETETIAAVRIATTDPYVPDRMDDTVTVAGIVSLPGMMTGQILAGAPPFEAVKYQVVVMFMIASATSLGAMLVGLLVFRRLTTVHHQLAHQRLRSLRRPR